MTVVGQKRSEFGSAGDVHRWAALASFAESLFAASTVEERAVLIAHQMRDLAAAAHTAIDVRLEQSSAVHAEVGEPVTDDALRVVEVPLTSRDALQGAIRLTGTELPADDPVLAHYLQIATMAVDNAALFERGREALRARDEILTVVSHDLRTPLNAIALAAHVLARGALDEAERTAKVGHVLEAVRHAARLLDELLEVAQLDAGQYPLECQACDAQGLLEEAVALLRPAAEAHGVVVTVSVPDRFPLLRVDPLRVTQVLQNVLDNALRVSRGRIWLSIEPAGAEARVAVRDSGPGIPPDDLPRLFERFWRGSANVRGGAGLGLSIARGIIEIHGGRIWAENHPEGGATIFFTLPLASAGRA